MPPQQSRAVHIEGLRELLTAFKVGGEAMDRDLADALKSSAEPVQQSAEQYAGGILKRSAIDWSTMRVGITRHTVYVAPAQRRTVGSARKKLAPRLQTRALDPALEANRPRVIREVKDAVRDMGRAWGRV